MITQMLQPFNKSGLWVMLIVCLFTNVSLSQTLQMFNPNDSIDYTYIPFTKNKLVGFVDRSNKVMIEATFQNVSFFNDKGVAKVKQNDLFGMIDKKGNMVVPFIGNRDFQKSQLKYVEESFQSEVKLSGIYFFNNSNTGEWVLYSEKSKKASARYRYSKPKYDDRLSYYGGKSDPENPYFKYGYRKVEKADSSVNFIDTSFVEVFKKNVVNGMPVSRELFVVYDPSGKAALLRKDGTIIVPHIYYAIENSGWPGYYIASVASNSYTRYKGLIDQAGKIILDTIYQEIKLLDKGRFILTQNGKSGVIDVNNNVVLPYEYAEVNYFTNGLCYAKKGNAYFLYDQTGKQVSGPFQTIERYSRYPMLTSQRQDTTLFIDSLGRVAFIKPGKFNLREYTPTGIVVTKDNLKGLISPAGKTLLEPVYEQITFTWIDDVFMVGKTDRSAGLFSPSKGWIVPMQGTPQKITVQGKNDYSPDNVIVVVNDKTKTTYTNALKNIAIDSLQNVKGRSSHYITETAEQKIIHLPNGTSYPYPKDRSIDVNTNDKVVYFKKRENKDVVILNSKMEPVLPPDFQYSNAYEYQGSYVFTLISRNGKVGIYHLDGKWIYGPVEGSYISRLSDQVWIVKSKDVRLLGKDFKPISDELYTSADTQGGLIKAQYKEGNLIDLYSLNGKLLSKGAYSGMHHYTRDRVTLQKAQHGDLLSCVVDTLIHSEVCFPYAYLMPLDNNADLFIVKDLYDYGVINRQGEELYPCIYEDIKYWPELGLFVLEKGKSYMLVNEQTTPIISDSKKRIEKQKLRGDYWLIEGEEKNLFINGKTKGLTSFPASLGRLQSDLKLINYNLLAVVNGNVTTYLDAEKGMVYNGIQ